MRSPSLWPHYQYVGKQRFKSRSSETRSREIYATVYKTLSCNNDFSVPADMVVEVRKSFGEGNGMSWALNVNEALGRWRRKLGMFLLCGDLPT